MANWAPGRAVGKEGRVVRRLGSLAALAAFTVAAVVAARWSVVTEPRARELPERPRGAAPARILGDACWAPGTAAAVMQRQGSAIYGLGLRYYSAGRWPGTPNTPVMLTYSFPPDGTPTDGGPSVLHALLDGEFAALGGESTWKSLFRQSADEWEAVTGNRFAEVGDDGAPWPNSPGVPGVRGDIRICARNIDGPSQILAFTYYPASGGDMLLDAADGWAGSFANFRHFRNTIAHELGHAQGLMHSCPGTGQTNGGTKLMEPVITTGYDGPQQDDIRGIQSLYGDPLEPNDTTLAATDLDARTPPLMIGIPLTIAGVSVNGATDADVYRLVAPPNGTISVVAAPTGFQYLNGPQNGDGSCSPGTVLDPLRQEDLTIEILGSSGAVILTRNVSGLGGAETLDGFSVGALGTFYVRVRAVGGTGAAQAYTVTFTLGDMGLTGDLNHDGCVNSTDLGILLGSWGGTASTADLNGDGVVNSVDLAALLGAWGQGCGPR